VLGDSLVSCLGRLVRMRAVLLELVLPVLVVLGTVRLWYCRCSGLLGYQILLDLIDDVIE
jgi:hypothetical protein